MKILLQNIPSVHKEDEISVGIKPIERNEANVEVEKGELVIKPDLSAIHKAGGKKHKGGGTPVFLEPNSFIYSDDPILALTKKDHELFELKKGGSFARTKNTPAEVLKKNVDLKHYNKMSAIINNDKKDNIAKTTAMLMMGKYLEKAGQVAYLQEEKKNFPNGVPEWAEDSAPVYDDDVKDEITETKQYMKYGGGVLPKAQKGNPKDLNEKVRFVNGKTITPEQIQTARYLYDNGLMDDLNKYQYAAYINKMNHVTTGEQSMNFGPDPYKWWQKPLQESNLPPVEVVGHSPQGKWLGPRAVGFSQDIPEVSRKTPMDYVTARMNNPLPFIGRSGNPDAVIIPWSEGNNTTGTGTGTSGSGDNSWKGFTEDPTNEWARWKNYMPNQAPSQCPPGFYKGPNGQCISFVDANKNKHVPTQPTQLNQPTVNGDTEQPFGLDTKINWLDKANIANQLFNTLNINRYMPMRSQVRTSVPDAALMDSQGVINQTKQAYVNATAGNQIMNPFLAGVQNNLMYGRTLDSINQIQGQYDQQNNQILNQNRGMKAQAAAQDALTNLNADQNYYKESIVGATNFDNMRSFNRNRLFETATDAYTNAMQANAMNMQLGPNAPYYFDYGKMKVTPNPNRDIMAAQSNSKNNALNELFGQLKDIKSMSKEEYNAWLAKIRLATASSFPTTQRKGGKFRGRIK